MRTLAHLSDLHFGRVDEALLAPLRRTLEDARPDLVIVSGDLTQRARTAQFEAARDYLDTLPKPQLIVPGNHDVPLYNVFQRFAAPLEKFRRIVNADLAPAYVDDEIAVVGVNTARALVFKGGRINADQIEHVSRMICALPREMVKIIVTHHPFNVPQDSDEENQIVTHARRALEKLAGCGADVLVSGHLHKAHVGHTADRYDIAGVSALVVHAGTAISTRSRGESNSFNILRVDARRIEIDRYVWADGAFTVEATESFDHDEKGWHADARRDAAD